MNAALQSLITRARESYEAWLTNGRPKVNVCIDTSSLARGADETLRIIRETVAREGIDADIGIIGSWGFCWMEPTVTVRTAGGTRTILYGNVTPDRAEEFVRRVLVDGEEVPELAIAVVEGVSNEGIVPLGEHPFMQGQVRRLMANCGIIDPENIDHYLARGGYEGFANALERTPEEIIKEVLDSGLGGRGGGGFPTGRKWDFLRTATAEPKYLVCNADEGDPGAWVNRILMESDPQLVIEGMLIAARATGAREGYIYIRYEYPLAFQRMKVAVAQAYERGLLGTNICGSGLDFDLIVFRGAGSYVCGEETGLMSSIDGYRGMPRIKPPFPAQAGLWNKPTNVNNVESYANAPLILRHGAAWWSSVSDAKDKGTKMFTLSGAIKQMGCIEIPFGYPVRRLLEQYGGGMRDGSVLKGFQPGGPLSGILPASEIDLPVALDPYRERGMFLGSGGIIFFDQHTSVVDLCTYFVGFAEDESCGRCTTCHGGTQRAVEILRRMAAGGGRDSDLDKLEELTRTLVWSNCLHGQFALTTVKLALRYFRDEFETVIREKRDPAGVLSGLIRYEIANQADPLLPEAADICPTDAIVETHEGWTIVDELCVRCGACREVAPGAVRVVERFAQPAAEPTAAAAR
ncbi:NADP-reducing hydrogenase subunit HndC [bacterium HR29]|jgi:NADH-quinone oxidoreductase subunit F|nr:NADP-reducing hydrogenase subunit HndC [bacterium HR29]